MNISRQMVAWTIGTVLVVGGVSAAAAIGPIFPIPNVGPASTQVAETPEPSFTPAPTVTPTPTVAPAEVAPPAPVAPVVVAPAPQPAPAPVKSGAPHGTPLPFTASSDPQNASGGDYADPGTFCASKSASTVNGVPTCD